MFTIDRRKLLTGGATFASMTALGTNVVKADVPAGRDPFDYEVTHTEAEWREKLGDAYGVLREGNTEPQYTTSLWAEARQGVYNCRGCELEQYSSFLKVNLLKGWVFFTAAQPNAQLMSQDTGSVMGDELGATIELSQATDPFEIDIEVHCRRCGSHMGHILLVEGSVLHCINGTAMDFVPNEAA